MNKLYARRRQKVWAVNARRKTAAAKYAIATLPPTARAQALFASTVSVHSRPTTAEVEAAISDALLAYGGIGGCAGEMAAAYGDHPETAAPRMCWARQVVHDAFPAEQSAADAA